MSFNDNGREGTRWTDILTGATADTDVLVDSRHHGRLVIIRIRRHHLNGSRRTVARTVAALHTIRQRHAVLLDPHGMANLNRRLLNIIERFDSTRRTDIGAARTLWTAIAALVRHRGLHQVHQVGRGTEHMVRTLRHTELAPRTARSEVGEGTRARRCQRRLALWYRLILEFCQTTIHQFLFLLGHGSRRGKSRSQQERALRSINRSTPPYSFLLTPYSFLHTSEPRTYTSRCNHHRPHSDYNQRYAS